MKHLQLVVQICVILAFPPLCSAATIFVRAGDDLQAVLNAAQPGDEIVLEAGATFTGGLWLPPKPEGPVITVRSSAPLPNRRITPADDPLLPRIASGSADPSIYSAGARNWKFDGIRFMSTAGGLYNVIALDTGSANITFDRILILGGESGQRRGIAANGANIALTRSHIGNIWQSPYESAETAAVGAWQGPGPLTIVDNYLEASGMSILLGGADSTDSESIVSDAVIERNYLTKRLEWLPGGSNPMPVKNILEIKCARRVTIRYNILERNWTAGQSGWGVLFTVHNDGGNSPWSRIEQIVFEYNILRDSEKGINVLGNGYTQPSGHLDGLIIRNNLIRTTTTSAVLIGGEARNVTIDHNTFINGPQDGGGWAMLYRGGIWRAGEPGASDAEFAVQNLVVTNNLTYHNASGLNGDISGPGTAALTMHAAGYSWDHNVMAHRSGHPYVYPNTTWHPTAAEFQSHFVDHAMGDFRLAPGSAYKGAGTDGVDLGADVAAIEAGINGSTPAPPPPSAGTSSAFHGTPVALPGRIEMEDFDEGDAGAAYRDNSSGNEGGEYRATDVDIAWASDSSGAYTIGWVGAGEWLSYSVDLTAAGAYDVAVRVASSGPGGTFHIEIDGVDRTGPIVVPDTGGWTSWSTITQPGISVPSGGQVWRLVMDTTGPSGAVGNFNFLSVVPAAGVSPGPDAESAASVPGTIEAERFDDGPAGAAYQDNTPGNEGGACRATDVDIADAFDAGGGYTIGWAEAGEWTRYTVNVQEAGSYDLHIRVASQGTGGVFHIEVDGIDKTGPLAVPDTSGWQSWTTITRTGIPLGAGLQTWRLVMDAAGAAGAVGNLNFIRVEPAGGASIPFGGGAVLLPGAIEMENFDLGTPGVAYVDNSPGNEGGVYRATDVDIADAFDSVGDYTLGWAGAGEWTIYTVDVSQAGTYDLEFRVASRGAGGTFHVEIDGIDRTGPIRVPDSGGWHSWVSITRQGLTLAAGRQRWRLVMEEVGDSGAVGNFNFIRVTSAGGQD